MSFTRRDVEEIAHLARLRPSPAELEVLAAHLAQIVSYIEQLREVDTRDVPPLMHPGNLKNVLADDIVAPSLDRVAALANAPKRDTECFLVPAVLGGNGLGGNG